MKMSILSILFFSLFTSLTAPPAPGVIMIQPEAVNYYEPLIKAIVNYESKGDIYAFNFLEQAAGPMQIRPIRIDHFNRLNGTSYTTADCFNMELSQKVFMYFAKGKDYEHAAKDWNGSGPMTINYWKQIKARL